MIERTVSSAQVSCGVAWSVTVLLYATAGAIMLLGNWLAAIFIAEVACGVSAFAAVQHLRTYAMRICHRIDETALERDVARLTGVPGQRVR